MKISLRGRIALWYFLALSAVIFALAFTAQQIMVVSMKERLDNTLRERGELLATTIRSQPTGAGQGYADIMERLIEQQFPSIPLLIRITNPTGAEMATFGDIPDVLVPALDRHLMLAFSQGPALDTLKIRGVEALRVYTLPVNSPSTGQTLAYVQTAESLAQVTAAQNRLWLYTIIEGLVGSLLMLVIGMLILDRGLRPLNKILRRVQQVESSNLQQVLPEEPRPPELQQLANSLNEMWRRLDAAFKEKQAFIASVSHDLRTPLTALQGQIEVLLMQPSLNGEVKQSLERMSKEARRLVRMANNLLLNAQLEAKPTFSVEPVNLRELLEEIVAQVWVLADGLQLNLADPEDVIALGDYDLFKQMALNLVDNAIKFTPRGGRVDISLAQEEGWAVLTVADTGVGIPPEHLPYVMEAFYKVHSPVRSASDGAGLGLAIVRRVVDLHQGQVHIQSQQGVGTTVTVRLPLEPAEKLAGRAKV